MPRLALIRIQTLDRAYLFATIAFSYKFCKCIHILKIIPPEFSEASGMALYDAGASVSIVIVSGWFDMNSVRELYVSLGNWPIFDDDI